MSELGLITIGAVLAFGFGAMATAIVQAKIGPAAVAAILEKKESFGAMVILLVIPETLVIFGFTVTILILFGLK